LGGIVEVVLVVASSVSGRVDFLVLVVNLLTPSGGMGSPMLEELSVIGSGSPTIVVPLVVVVVLVSASPVLGSEGVKSCSCGTQASRKDASRIITAIAESTRNILFELLLIYLSKVNS
jgi:hypothetical protein